MGIDEANRILNVAQSAYDNIPFYAKCYGFRPKSLEDIPYISYVDYHKAESMIECMNSDVVPYGVLPPFHRDFRRLPFTIIESNDDIDQRQLRLQVAIEDLHLEKNSRLLIVSNEENGPFACDLSTGLGWDGIAASIYYHLGSDADLHFQVEAHQPNNIIWCLDTALLSQLSNFDKLPILAHHIDFRIPDYAGPIMLFSDEMNLVGSRPEGRSSFAVCDDQLFIERDELGNQYITSLTREMFPIIRYKIPHRFEVKS